MSKKLGRPKLDKSVARGKFVSTRLSPKEYKEISDAVSESPKAKTEWVRDSLLNSAQDTQHVEPTEFNNPEDGRYYLILYSRRLVGDEMRQAVQTFKPKWVFEDKSRRPCFVVTPDYNWQPSPSAQK